MRFFISILLSFQFMFGAMAVELGEGKQFNPKSHLRDRWASTVAHDFDQHIREGLALWARGDFKQLPFSSMPLARTERPIFEALFKNVQAKVNFQEMKPGWWVLKKDGNTLGFTLAQLYQGEISINGKIFHFKGVPFSELEKNLEKFDKPQKVSVVEFIFNNTFGISDAEAIIPFIILGVVVGVIALYALYELKWHPESTVKKINKLREGLEKDAATCQESKSSEAKYDETFQLAKGVSDEGLMSSATDPADALKLAIKKQIESGDHKNEDCFQLMHEAGDKLDVDIPMPSQSQIEMMTLNDGSMRLNTKTDVKGALYNMCKSYNAYESCLSQFVGIHVNSSDIDSFSDEAEPDFKAWQRASKQ